MIDDFDFGAETGGGYASPEPRVWPTEGRFTALIDADSIPYIVGFCATDVEALRYRNGDASVLREKIGQAQFLINQWVTRANADSARLYITESTTNFRLDIGRLRLYKGHRVAEKPHFFREIKDWLRDFQKAEVAVGCEADDLLSREAWSRIRDLQAEGAPIGSRMAREFSNHTIISQDKDLMMIPHMHHIPETGDALWVTELGELLPKYRQKDVKAYQMWPLFDGEPVDPSECRLKDGIYRIGSRSQDVFSRGKRKGEGKTKRVTTGMERREYVDKLKGNGLMFFYAQILMGDTSDNYGGLEGCGVTKTHRILENCKTEQELHDATYAAYLEVYGEGELEMEDYNGNTFKTNALDLMKEQGQLAWMQTEEGELWLPLPLRG